MAEIAEFSGLGEYLKMPIRIYSSGMKMRLMFAIATAFNPDILLIDEMFSTGDEDFQNKATARIEQKIAESKIFVFASHDLSLIRKYCNLIFKMEHGVVSITKDLPESKKDCGLPPAPKS
jgi:ABC-type polysaccharide/polyol phosphate transport system ATPase subunit